MHKPLNLNKKRLRQHAALEAKADVSAGTLADTFDVNRLPASKTRQEAIRRIARQSEALGEYDRFVPVE